MQQKFATLACVIALTPSISFAGPVNRVYSPGVEKGEFELEAIGTRTRDNNKDLRGEESTRLGAGYGLTSRWFAEAYVEFEKVNGESRELESWEVENRFEITEHNQFWLNTGLLLEVEKIRDEDLKEVTVGPILQKQLGDWVVTANILAQHQYGSEAESNKWQSVGAAQIKYRYSKQFEPAIEYYGDESNDYAGPAILGSTKLGSQKLKYQAGWLFGARKDTPDQIVRWVLELEF